MSINKVLITGNLTRDPQQRMAGQTPILELGVAVNDRRRNQQTGEYEDYPNYVDCSIIGKRVPFFADKLSKGMKVAIEGHLHYSSWQDKSTGQKRSKLDVTVDELEFLSSGNRQQQGGYQQPSAHQAVQQTWGAQATPYSDEDLPF